MKTKITLLSAILLLSVVIAVNAQVPSRAGWWKFDDPLDLTKAEIGAPLAGPGTSVDGPVIGNKAIQVELGSYLSMAHGIAPNGGGTMVNEYTLLLDFSVPQVGIWHSFFQTDLTNTSDADLFIKDSNNSIGVGATGYTAKGVSVDTWYRMVVSVKNGEFFKVYIDGILWLDATATIQPVDGRMALADQLILFGDNDGDDATIKCSEAAIWDVALNDVQVTALGDASGNRSRVRTRLGWWKFDDALNMTKAEVGAPLVLTGTQSSVAGPEAGNLATQIGLGSYLSMAHGIGLNGTDTLVNEYSVQIDFSVPTAGIWHSFIQTDPTNLSDADLFTKTDNTVGTLQTGYSTDVISANTWYRMLISVKNGEFFRVYVNGILYVDAPDQGVDGRFGLSKTLLLFADNDGDDAVINCSEISIWEVALTENEVVDLGTDPANTIPARMGWWKFEDSGNMTKAEIGNPLELTGTQDAYPGPAVGNQATFIGVGSYLTMNHGITANGGGAMVNEYTLQLDFSVPSSGLWYTFFQTDLSNGSDGDLFIASSDNTIGTQATSYSTNAVVPSTWYRMIVSVKNGVFFKVYLNGELWIDAAGQAIDGRFALADALLLFADNDGDDAPILCSEAAIWDVALNSLQAIKLGDANTSLSTGIESQKVNSNSHGLGQNYPNPFANSTTFPYEIQKTGTVNFRIIDLAGNEVRTINEGRKSAGNYTLELNSGSLKNGVYYLQMLSGDAVSTRKMVVIK